MSGSDPAPLPQAPGALPRPDPRGRSAAELRARTAFRLRALAALLLVTGAGGAVLLARMRVMGAADALLVAEATAAAELVALHDGFDALDTLVPGRWQWLEGVGTRTDAVDVTAAPGGGRTARVPTFAADGWTPTGALVIEARPRSAGPRGALALALLVAVVSAIFVRVGNSALLVAGGALGLALTVGFSSQEARAALVELTDARLAVAVQALAAVPGPTRLAERPGEIARVGGLPFVVTGGPATVLPEARAALEALPDVAPTRTVVDRVPFATASVSDIRVVLVPYEHTHDPRWRSGGAAALAFGLALLPLSLLPLTGDRRGLRRTLTAWAFLAPSATHLLVFTAFPLAFAAWLSVHRWNLIDPARPFVGLDHYRALLHDRAFWRAILNTIVFTLHVPVSMALALALALLAQGRTRVRSALRAAFFLPGITSVVAIAVVWKWMLNDDYGIVNGLLTAVGLPAVPWLTAPGVALLSLMALAVWMVLGYQMVLFQAGLTAIPRELYDAARIDGAGPWRRFLHVTLPGLRPTLFFVAVTSVIGSFQVFAIVFVMTEGGPLGATDVAVFHIYREAWRSLRFGSAAAMSWVLFALIFAATWLHFRVLERRVAAT